MDEQLVTEIQAKIECGDDYLNEDEFAQAIRLYKEAVALIPEPKYSHAISLDAFMALGEGYFFSGYYDDALRAFNEALKAPGGVQNPLTHLRMGQSFFEIGEMDFAADLLTRAYALDGARIFDDEDDKYRLFLATRISM